MSKHIKEVEIECPLCKKTGAEEITIGESNGVCGPGYYFHVTNKYYVCLNCGVHFDEVKKPVSGA